MSKQITIRAKKANAGSRERAVMSRNYTPLGAKARAVLTREEKRGTDLAKQERKEILAYHYRIAATRRKLRQSSQLEETPPEVTISIHANDKGFCAHLAHGKRAGDLMHVALAGTPWGNGLDGVIAALETVEARSEMVIVHSDPQIAATLNPDTLAQYENDGWLDPRTGMARRHAEKWQRIKQLLDGQVYVAVSDKEMSSPVLDMCCKELRKRVG